MKKLFTLLFAFILHAMAFAVGETEIKPGENNPLIDHLNTVNSLWSQVNTDNPLFAASASFVSDTERIEAHLLHVVALLRSTAHPEFDEGSLSRRADLLTTLETYARGKNFPVNTSHAYRIPYFIDYTGTPCAVGHLIIESGFEPFAEKVKTEMNNAYLKEMPYSEIPAWANDHGFTTDELALIQPGYPPNTNWLPLQGGVNGEVRVMLELEDENALVIAGTFTNAGGVECTNVVKWNGSEYIAMGEGIEGNVVTGAVLDGEIYLGGSLGQNTDLAYWTGEEWELTGVFAGSGPPEITDLYVNDGVMYAAGATIGFAGTSYGVSRLEVSGWDYLQGDFNGPIHSMTHYQDQLVIGGAFTGYNFTDPVVPYIAAWNGSDWAPVGTEFLGIIYTVTVFQDTLVAGGQLPVSGISNAVGVIYWDETENEWVSAYSDPEAPSDHAIKEFKVIDNKLLVCGRYDINEVVGIIGSNAGFIYDLQEEMMMPIPIVWNDGPVYAAAQVGNELYLGGNFAHINMNEEVDFNNVMYYSITSNVNNVRENQIQIYPNPTASEMRIHVGEEIAEAVRFFDMRGRLFMQELAMNSNTSIDISALPAGIYVVQIQLKGAKQPVHKKIVVQ